MEQTPITGYRPSYWESTTFLKPADVAIIGGGLTGLQTALEVKQLRPDWEVVVLERSPFGQGASTRNAGFACFGAPTELLEDIALHGERSTWDTIERRYAGIRRLESQYGNSCDYEKLGGYEVFSDPKQYQKVLAALPALNVEFERITGHTEVWKIGSDIPGLKPDTAVVYNQLEGQLHPAKLVRYLIDHCHQLRVRLLFGAAVARIESEGVEKIHLSNGLSIKARQIALTTNAFSHELLRDLPIKPARNQVMITKPILDLKLRGCFHHERGYVYFRNVGSDRLLIGGARHLAGLEAETTNFGPNPIVSKSLNKYLSKFIQIDENQQIEIAQEWSGIIAQGGKSPIVQRHPNGWVLALRMSGMGVALSAQAAQQAARLLLASD